MRKRKFLSPGCLAVLLALLILPSLFSGVSAENRTSDGLIYVASSNHVEIVGYNGSASHLTIPSEIE